MPQVTSPVTAGGVGDFLKWLAEAVGAQMYIDASNIRQGVSSVLQGANVALSYPGAMLTSFLTGEPAEVPEYRPYDPWKDPRYVAAQQTVRRRPVERAPATAATAASDSLAPKLVPDQVLTGQAATVQELQQRGIQPTYTLQPAATGVTVPATNVAPGEMVTIVPDQIKLGLASSIKEIHQKGMVPTYFLATPEERAYGKPAVQTDFSKFSEAAKVQGPLPDQVILGFYPSVEAMRQAGAQPTYALWPVIQEQLQKQQQGEVQTGSRVSPWVDVYRRQQDVLDVLGVVSERAQALRLAAQRATATPGASVAKLYFEQGFEPILRQYGYTDEQITRVRQELEEHERGWRQYGGQQQFADYLWTVGFDPFAVAERGGTNGNGTNADTATGR